MHMAKGGKKKAAKSYDSGTLAFLAGMGVLLIAAGVLSLLAIVGGLQGAFFTQVKAVMQGLGGTLCIGIPVLLIWGGLLVAFSSGRGMPKRGFFLMCLLYLAVQGVMNLLSKVGEYGLMEYAVAANNSSTPPMVDAGGFLNVLKTIFAFSGNNGAFGGAVGVLLAWPAWTFLGTTIGAAVLILICLICVLIFSRFDVLGAFRQAQESMQQRQVDKGQKRAQQEYQRAIEDQQHQQAEDERKLLTPAFRRRGKREQEEATPMSNVAAQPYPPYGSMLVQAPPPMPPGYGYGYPPVQQPPTQQPPTQQPQEMYDEIIIPQGHQLPWRKNDKKSKKEAADAYQTRMSFTPREMGVEDEDGKPLNQAMILSGAKRKAMEQVESIRRRKAAISEELQSNQLAEQAEAGSAWQVAPLPQTTAPVPMPVLASMPQMSASAPMPQMPAQQQPVPAPMTQDNVRVQASAPHIDRDAAYKRPPEEVGAPAAKPLAQPLPSYAPGSRVLRTEEAPSPEVVRPTFAPARAQVQAPKQQEPKQQTPYVYPAIDLLTMQQRKTADTRAIDTENATKLEKTLESFGIPARVQRVTHGPAVTRFELGLVSSGINVKRIMSIADNIALDMAANGGVRIEIPIPGTNLFGIEVPNKEIQSVCLAEVLLSPEMENAKSPLAVALGRDIAGKPIICDLAKMPHLLIAGQTGSGKSVCINAIITSMLYRSSPEEVRMIMIDPKVVELQCYNVVPHLLIPVVSDPHKAAGALAWAVAEMLDRYHKMQSKNVRELGAYNANLGPGEEKIPRIVIIIDELADLMLACKKEVEESIIRLAQLARAAGIHMVVATQRPTVDVITGLIKANVPSRIAFAVSSSIDSRTILDQNGAEKLLGRGDM
ncbi:MAG: DNA translocase FtsK, partial [Clostridia bacterium]